VFSSQKSINFTPFAFNDAIDAQAYDPLNQRLVVASHSGEVKMFTVQNCGERSARFFFPPLFTSAIFSNNYSSLVD
jgi:hypothetical protein